MIDSLTTRLAEVERERDEQAKKNAWLNEVLEEQVRNKNKARSQLTQAREAWDVWTEHCFQRHGCDWGYTERPEALATINREGETE